jgi:hypothetical protein
MRRSLAAFLIVAVTGCAMPTVISLPGHAGGPGCRGIGVGGVVRGDPLDPEVVWLEDPATGERLELRLRWPPGSVARFAPDVEIVLADGRVLYADGDEVAGGCRGADMGGVNIVPDP